MRKYMRKYIWLLFLGLWLAACGGPQPDYYVPANEALAEGNSAFCGTKVEFTITKIEENSITAKAICLRQNTNGLGGAEWSTVSETTFTAPKTQEVMALLNDTHYSWGIMIDENSDLLQIFEGGGSNGLVHIHWQAPSLEEVEKPEE